MPNANHRPASKQLNVVGLAMTPLVEAPVAGDYEVFLQEGAEGVGPGPHSHPWDETFYLLEGEVSFGLGDESPSLAPATWSTFPRGRFTGSHLGPVELA